LSAPDGSFEFANVSDGDWRLSAVRNGDVILRAQAGVTIAGREAQDVELRLSAPFNVPVEFFLQTSDSTTTISADVVLRPAMGGGRNAPVPVTRRDKNGKSWVEAIYPGRYLVNALTPPGYYAASITLGNQDILGQMVEFSPDSAPLQIIYRSDGGAIRGMVEDCGNATVVVVPEDPALQRGEIAAVRYAPCDEVGHFEIHNLHPAKYYAFAFDQPQRDVSSFLSSLPSLINQAVAVDVKANESSSVDVQVTSSF